MSKIEKLSDYVALFFKYKLVKTNDNKKVITGGDES